MYKRQAIGTGLFVGSGEVIRQAGALGAILAYIFGGAVTYMVMMCLGELTAYLPASDSFSYYATRFIGPGTGYMIAWAYWLTWTLTLGVDFTAAGVISHEWLPSIPIWSWVLFFCLLILLFNLYSTRLFVESEFYLSLIKVLTVMAFIVLGLVVLTNLWPLFPDKPYPDKYLENFSSVALIPEGLLGILSTMLLVSFSFTGTELVAVAAGETVDPSKSVPQAIKATFWRLLVMFIGTISIIAFLFPRDILGLKTSEGVSTSPFILLFQQLNIPYTQEIIRIVIIIALLSSASAGLYGASRMLWAMSKEYHLPPWLSKLNGRSVPVYTVLLTTLGGAPGLFLKYFSLDSVLNVIIDLSAFTMILVWMAICLSHYNFHKEHLKQYGNLKDLPYVAPWFPFLPMAGLICLTITALSMLIDKSRLPAFICCLVFVAACYIYYYWKEYPARKKSIPSIKKPRQKQGL